MTVGVLPVLVGVVRSLRVTLIPNSASSANATCMLDVFAMVPVSIVLSPFALRGSRRIRRPSSHGCGASNSDAVQLAT